ncbi:MAG: aminoacetone oxidase family FAD-binding enzyme [Eubacterium sp.]|nr:aminoacetone oxidase family FAD-binding enzyme [Eubacterium sp.]
MDKIYDVCIIGAGAAGLVAAIESSRRGLSSVVLDKNKKPGMKLYATGNGRCNLTNDTWEEDSYYGNEFVDSVFGNIYYEFQLRPRNFIIDYFKKLGITIVNKNGYIYPSSLQASTVVWALVDAAKAGGAEIISNFITKDIKYITDSSGISYYEIRCINKKQDTEDIIYSSKLILATGGISSPELGAASNDQQRSLFNNLGLPVNDFSSGLCPVRISEDLSMLNGIRTRAVLSVGSAKETGEIQFTDYGISGIVTFNMSYYMKPGEEIHINLMTSISEDDFVEHFNMVKSSYPERSLIAFLNGYINDKLALYFNNSYYGNEVKLKLREVTESGIRYLYQEMCDFKLTVLGKCDINQSQASIGGIITKVISPETMKISVERYKGSLAVAGEVTDVIGKCGGYNLTYAFITGFLAGRNI